VDNFQEPRAAPQRYDASLNPQILRKRQKINRNNKTKHLQKKLSATFTEKNLRGRRNALAQSFKEKDCQRISN
jgi:hypothetical protein